MIHGRLAGHGSRSRFGNEHRRIAPPATRVVPVFMRKEVDDTAPRITPRNWEGQKHRHLITEGGQGITHQSECRDGKPVPRTVSGFAAASKGSRYRTSAPDIKSANSARVTAKGAGGTTAARDQAFVGAERDPSIANHEILAEMTIREHRPQWRLGLALGSA